MSSIKILIVEDEPIIAADLEKQLNKMGYDVLATFETGESAITFVQNEKPDVILMDIHLEGHIDGIDTAHSILKDNEIPIIFLTSNTDQKTFIRAKLTKPHAFLSKPFRAIDIMRSIDLAVLGKLSGTPEAQGNVVHHFMNDRIFIRENLYLKKVMLRDILYVEADSAYSKVVTKSKSYLLSQTLKKFMEKLSRDELIRIHRSYVINIMMVDKISDGFVHIEKKRIPVGRSYKEQLQNLYKSL